jgi:hypothetical protein
VSQFPRARPTTAPRKPRAPRLVRTHVLVTSGQTDYAGVPICHECGNLGTHKIHDLTVASEAMEIDRRIVGDRDGPTSS